VDEQFRHYDDEIEGWGQGLDPLYKYNFPHQRTPLTVIMVVVLDLVLDSDHKRP
jgi:hypothetical protein